MLIRQRVTASARVGTGGARWRARSRWSAPAANGPKRRTVLAAGPRVKRTMDAGTILYEGTQSRFAWAGADRHRHLARCAGRKAAYGFRLRLGPSTRANRRTGDQGRVVRTSTGPTRFNIPPATPSLILTWRRRRTNAAPPFFARYRGIRNLVRT